MASVTKHYCDWDGCKKEASSLALSAFSHSSADASGNGSEQWYAKFDLCIDHLKIYVEELVESLEKHGRFGAVKSRSPFEIVKGLGIQYELR